MQPKLKDTTLRIPLHQTHGHQSLTVPQGRATLMARQKLRLALHRTSLAVLWLCMTALVAELRVPCCQPASSWCENRFLFAHC